MKKELSIRELELQEAVAEEVGMIYVRASFAKTDPLDAANKLLEDGGEKPFVKRAALVVKTLELIKQNPPRLR